MIEVPMHVRALQLKKAATNETARQAWNALLREIEAQRIPLTPELEKHLKAYKRLLASKIKCSLDRLKV